ncbi:MAG: 4-alpha-glucanotransferase [Hymenobacter sp.]
MNEVLFVPAAAADFYHPRITPQQNLLVSRAGRRRGPPPAVRRHLRGLFLPPPRGVLAPAGPREAAARALRHRPAHLRRRPGHGARLGARRDAAAWHSGPEHPADARQRPRLEFSHPNDAPYLSVVTTSSHDMSTLRGWWEEDRVAHPALFRDAAGPLA